MSARTSTMATSAVRTLRKDRLLRERIHDPYKARHKLPEPTVCSECGAVYHQGRWQWTRVPPNAHEEECPACRRIQDRCPAGLLLANGAAARERREQVLNLARNVERRAMAEHPLERIIDVQDTDDGILITTTDAHLARRIGEQLRRAHKGDLHLDYVEESDLLRATWTANAPSQSERYRA